jgi:GNAT superfamily N-acetyltransferase
MDDERLKIRIAIPSDEPMLRRAVVVLQDAEHDLHPTRLPGEAIADAYLAWMMRRAAESGAVVVAEVDGASAGFASGWVEEENAIAETPDSNRYGLVSDVCVLPDFRGRRIAARLIDDLSERLYRAGVSRLRIGALAANIPARMAYERAGFAPYEVIYEKVIERGT